MFINEFLDRLYVNGWLNRRGLELGRSILTAENYAFFTPFRSMSEHVSINGEEWIIFMTAQSRIAIPRACFRTVPEFYQFVLVNSE